MPRGKKTDNKMIAKIMTSYALTNSYNATAKELGIGVATVKDIIEKNKDEFEKVRKEKKEVFLEQANVIINKALELLNKRYDKALNNEEELEQILNEAMCLDKEEMTQQEKMALIRKINKLELNSLSEITTSMGTLYDKMRLANGESTQNIDVSYEEYLKEVADSDEY